MFVNLKESMYMLSSFILIVVQIISYFRIAFFIFAFMTTQELLFVKALHKHLKSILIKMFNTFIYCSHREM